MDLSMPDFEQDRLYKKWEKLHLEQLAVHERWRATGLCAGLDDFASLQIAYMMENQRLFNEDGNKLHWFRRISIPLVRRVFHPESFIGWHVGSVQVLREPKGLVKSLHHGRPVFHEVIAKTRSLKLQVFDNDFKHEGLNTASVLEHESQKVVELTKTICSEINQEVLGDLHKVASHKTTIAWKPGDDAEEMWPVIRKLRENVRDRTGFLPNWLVATPEVATALKAKLEHQPIRHDPEWGVVITAMLEDELMLIENRETKNHDCILGYKGSNFGSQYLYCPYIPFTATPMILPSKQELEEGTEVPPKRGVLMRYGKKLLSNADNYYGVLRIQIPETPSN